jgi:pimeloyl-ACP methyl ester carboxylesterase
MLGTTRARALIAAAIALAVIAPPSPASAVTRSDADHYQFYFTSADGVNKLHADVLIPKGQPINGSVEFPVIMTVSPYLNHSDEAGDVGPSSRFYDFLNLSGALQKGYAYVMVDLPGFGGSAGCNDWGGTREQLGVRAAVEWASSQVWSNGKVALLGKSYDGWTGLMGIAQQPEGLAAVVTLEPVYSGYRYIWMNGVRRTNWPYGTSFTQYDAQPGPTGSIEYNVNGAPQAWCYPINIAGQGLDASEGGPYWAERNLLPTATGKTTPTFLTQGFLETNTKSDGAFEYWNNLAGSENRAWFGQFDHIRGWESTTGAEPRQHTGRSVFIEQVMRFLDEHLKGIEPPAEDPTVEVQDILGRWRAEEEWPPTDSKMYVTDLNTGTYTDNGSGNGLRPSESQGIWSVSQPLPHRVWLAGEPMITAGVEGVPESSIAANVYDVSPEGELTMISRGVSLLRGTGRRSVNYPMYGQDWPIPAGHRIAVLISPGDTNEFTYPATTRQQVTVYSAKIGLPFLTHDRTQFLPSDGTTPRLEQYLDAAKNTLSEAKIASSTTSFDLPAPLA